MWEALFAHQQSIRKGCGHNEGAIKEIMEGGRKLFSFVLQGTARYVAMVDERSLREGHACSNEDGAKDEDGGNIGEKGPDA